MKKVCRGFRMTVQYRCAKRRRCPERAPIAAFGLGHGQWVTVVTANVGQLDAKTR